MDIDLSRFKDAFFEEAGENLTIIEGALLELEQSGTDKELLDQIFRAAHSIKGGSGTFAFERLARFTHAMESLLDPLREQKLELTNELASLLLRATDVLGGLLESERTGAAQPANAAEVQRALENASTPGSCESSADVEPVQTEPTPREVGTRAYRVRFEPHPPLFMSGMDPTLLIRNLCELGEVQELRLDTSSLPPLEDLDAEQCHLKWSIVLETECPEAELLDVFAFAEDVSTIEIEALDSLVASEVDVPDAPTPATDAAQSTSSEPAPEASPKGAPVKAAPERVTGSRNQSTLRVSTEKLDKLVNLVGELVIAQAMITQALNEPANDAVARAKEALAEMERNTRELQERVLSVRMVPIGTIFNRFQRLVRDLANVNKKKIRLELSGEETEVDKGIVEQIADPLTHLIRNSLDHGIEMPSERLATGKDETGTIRLSAYHQGGSVVIDVTDDGHGLDTGRIRDKGVRLGLIHADEPLSDDQIHALIFQPGFSTATAVTDISGRGVGMDVVRRNIDALSGSLTLTSERGAGTRFRIRLPLTLAIVDGLSLRIGEQVFVMPLLAIVESFRPLPSQLKTVFRRGEVVRVRSEPIPLIRLYEVLNVTPDQTEPCQALVVIVEANGMKIGLLVDELLGQAQVVVKSLEAHYKKVEGVMGATILGDGRVALILDVEGIARKALGATRSHQGADESAYFAPKRLPRGPSESLQGVP